MAEETTALLKRLDGVTPPKGVVDGLVATTSLLKVGDGVTASKGIIDGLVAITSLLKEGDGVSTPRGAVGVSGALLNEGDGVGTGVTTALLDTRKEVSETALSLIAEEV